MSSDNLSMDELTEERSKGIVETIRTISVEELKALGEGLFPYLDHPFRQRFFTFLEENHAETFHHATSPDGVHFIYCHAKGKGLWFLPGGGMGPLQPRGLEILKKIVGSSR